MNYFPLNDNEIKKILTSAKPPFVFLETAIFNKENKASFLFSNLDNILTFCAKDDIDAFFEKIEKLLKDGFWLAGYFTYEFSYWLQDVFYPFRKDIKEPLVWLGVCKKPEVFLPSKVLPNSEENHKDFKITNLNPNISKKEYISKIKKIKRYLQEGLTYQVNYTFKLNFKFSGNPVDLYLALRINQPTSYMSFINKLDSYIISLSPELFFKIQKNTIISKPMKGTIKRGLTLEDDVNHINILLNDKKSQAENIMIVDLLRNDIGKISKRVSVLKLLNIERYRTINQMTSTIRGKLKNNIKFKDIFLALFPCGSVTGAPKIKTMQIIRNLEKESRGVYTGAIGYISREKSCFNVSIRTIKLSSDKGEIGVGGGIVYDSSAEDEYKEALLKAKFLKENFSNFFLFESILWQKDKGFFLLSLHLKRLLNSCKYFSIPINLDKLKKDLEIFKNNSIGEDKLKVKILVNINGKITIEKEPIYEIKRPIKIKISHHRTNPNDIFLYHKSNKRELYDLELKKATKEGFFEVIFLNIYDEITEGSITNFFIKKNNLFYTSPIKCGLLGGVLREKLIREGKAKEKIIKLKDLKNADIYIGNSVRGLLEVENISCPFIKSK